MVLLLAPTWSGCGGRPRTAQSPVFAINPHENRWAGSIQGERRRDLASGARAPTWLNTLRAVERPANGRYRLGGLMHYPKRLWQVGLVGLVAVGTALSVSTVGMASGGGHHGARGAGARTVARNKVLQDAATDSGSHGAADGDLADQLNQFDFMRTAPAGFVSGDALVSATHQAAQLPTTGGSWQEFTNKPYNEEPSN